MIACNNCGQELPEESVFCNKCGSKIHNEINDEIAVTVSNPSPTIIEKPKKSRRTFFISILILILILGSGGGYWYYTDTQKKDEARQEAVVLKYKEDLSSAVVKMLGFSLISEKVCDLYSDVWRRAIEDDEITVNGKTASNFNDAIVYQREAIEDKDVLSQLSDNTADVDKLMKELNNPPVKYQKAYEILIELYGLYTQYADLADFPKGSLVEFNKNTNELSAEISKLFNQFKVLLPNLDEDKVDEYLKKI